MLKKLVLFLVLLSSICFAGMWDNDYTFPIAIIASESEVSSVIYAPQSITSVWTGVGAPIKVNGFQRIAFDIELDINSAENVRLKLVRMLTPTSVHRNFMVETVGTSAVSIESVYYEFNVDGDHVVSLDFDIFPIQYVQLQTSAGTESVNNPAQLDGVKYFLIRE